jgi:WD40 repeat protein/tRNA A-37 threonylcarbamoyl transferase component Bud32
VVDLSGSTLGQYDLIEVLGKGGSATVYRAHQTSIERMVAVKVVRGEVTADDQFKARFLREAKVIARLEHDRIVPIYDFGEERGNFYLVMRLLTASLSRLIRRTPMSVEQTNRMVQQVCQALHYAHEQNIVHRDLKPSNILLDRDNNAFLTDFGLARMVGGTSITSDNILLGTPVYMAPEMWQDAEVSPQTDLYALGIMIYEMLSGKPPFEAPTPAAVMYKHLQTMPPPLVGVVPGISEAAQLVLDKLLAKKPEDRYATAAEVADDFRKATLSVTREARGVTANFDETTPADALPQPGEVAPAERRAIVVENIAGKQPKIPPRPARTFDEQFDETIVLPSTPMEIIRRQTNRLLIASIVGLTVILVVVILVLKNNPFQSAPVLTADTTISADVLQNDIAAAGQRIFSAGQNALPALAWSPDNQRMAAADDAGDIFLWQVGSGQSPVQSWHADDGGVTALAWSPDGSMLASGGADRLVRIWKVSDGTLIQSLQGHVGAVEALAWSPDGSQLASGGADGRLYRWLASNNWETLGPYYTAFIMALAWSPDSTRIATSGQDHGVRIWNLDDGTNVVIGNHRAVVRAMNWSPDGQTIAAVSDDGEVRLWQANGTGTIMLARHLVTTVSAATPAAAGEGVGPSAVKFSPDGTRLAAADGTEIHIWDAQSTLLVSILSSDQMLRSLSWDSTGRYIAASTSVGTIQIWTAASGTLAQLGQGTTLTAHQGQVNGLAWNPAGSQIATIGKDFVVNIWNAATGEAVAHLTGGHTAELSAVAWSREGARLASGDCSGAITVWNVTQGQSQAFSTGSTTCVTGLAFSPDGKLLTAASTSGALYAWNVNTGDAVIARGVQASAINGLIWPEDASVFATTGQDGTLRLWQIMGNQLIPRALRQLNSTPLTALNWDGSGSPALTGGADGTLELWYSPLDSDSTDQFGQHPASITAVSRSSDGQWTASTDSSGCLIVWRTSTAERLVNLCPPTSDFYRTLHWSPDGDTLAAGTDNGKLTLWRAG